MWLIPILGFGLFVSAGFLYGRKHPDNSPSAHPTEYQQENDAWENGGNKWYNEYQDKHK